MKGSFTQNSAHPFQQIMRQRSGAKVRETAPGLTWVGGNLSTEDLDETSRKNLAASSSGTSIFDPVLCELIYRWFCPPAGLILDPFAGGSVRGIVAAKLGRRYTGIELRCEQIEANNQQAKRILSGVGQATWIQGDARNCTKLASERYDLVFTCPPYGDLEIYSDDPGDLSTLPFDKFITDYRAIITDACSMLKSDRFAAIVVGDFRDKKGFYRNFVSETISAFQSAGLKLYNEAVLITAVGSLPIRVSTQFQSSRKLGKTHQNVLVFIKGDPRKATAAIGPVEVADLVDVSPLSDSSPS